MSNHMFYHMKLGGECMPEENKPVDVYYDMEIAEICQHFSKSRNTVDKAVAKLVKDYPDAGYKYKNPKTRRITIKAEGVEKLSKYFRKQKHEVSTVEVELRYENEKLKAIIEEKEKAEKQIEELYKQRLSTEIESARRTFLLENKTKDEQIKSLTEESGLKDQTIDKLSKDSEKLNSTIDSLTKEKDDMDKQIDKLKEDNLSKSYEINKMLEDKKSLESENTMLKQKSSDMDSVKQELDMYKKRKEEYNSKSFFYRLTHKL